MPITPLLAKAAISDIFMVCVYHAGLWFNTVHDTMKNLLVVFTGGTIGSQLADGTINTSSNKGSQLLHMFNSLDSNPQELSFKTLHPLQILSENLHPQHWQTLISAIEAEDLSNFDGIIVTHGTDTLAFSAAALGLYFNNLPIPLVLVSSDLPLDNPQANGLANFSCAVEFIRRIPQRGVFVVYQNPGQAMQIYRGTRLASCLPLGSDFIGVRSLAFQTYVQNQFINQEPKPDNQPNPIKLNAGFSTRILLFRPYPGLDYTQYNLENIDIVLHDLYHSGTACASACQGEAHSLPTFIQHCRQRQIPVYLTPALKTEAAYASTRELLANGASMIWNMSLEAAYAKLLLAYGNFDTQKKISEFLEQDIAWEHVD